MEFSDLDAVVAMVPFKDQGVRSGQIGTIVHSFTHPSEAYLVEFANDRGETLAMVTAMPDQIASADLLQAA